MKSLFLRMAGLLAAGLFFAGCGGSGHERPDLTILAGSENKGLEPLIRAFEKRHRATVRLEYRGSVDIMLALQEEDADFDAVWPANSLWISLGDIHHRVKYQKSITLSPVIFGVRRSLADSLGFTGRPVRIGDILAAVRAGRLRFMMTSATQSNSGACAYLGFLYALAGGPDVLGEAHLDDPGLRREIRELLGAVHRSSGSSGWLKEAFLRGGHDAMVNYESMIVEANLELARGGRETLYAVYPEDGIFLSDSPLAFVAGDDPDKETLFRKLQAHLLSEEVQRELARSGRRPVSPGVDPAGHAAFNADWGVDLEKVLVPLRTPSAPVIRKALNLYQTAFRKPSFTVYGLDFSGSMEGSGETLLKEAMQLLLSPSRAGRYWLQMAPGDSAVIFAFSDSVFARWTVSGADTHEAAAAARDIRDLKPSGRTDLYAPVIRALECLNQADTRRYIPAVILLSDGESNTGFGLEDVRAAGRRLGGDVPVFGILFGEASREQMESLADWSNGRVFDGRTDLVGAFRSAKGYN